MKRTIFTVITLLWATIALADVTVNFTVPLNLQKMDPSLKHAAAKCFIKGADGKEIAFGYAHSTAPVSGNAVNGNAVVPVSLSFAQASSAKSWECELWLEANSSMYPAHEGGCINALPLCTFEAGAKLKVSGKF